MIYMSITGMSQSREMTHSNVFTLHIDSTRTFISVYNIIVVTICTIYKNIKHITMSDNTNCSYKIKYITHRNGIHSLYICITYTLFIYVLHMFISTKWEHFGFSLILFDRMWLFFLAEIHYRDILRSIEQYVLVQCDCNF